MSNTVTVSAAKKPAYKRPYKSRSQRRESDRRKYDESKDQKFLWRVAAGIGLLLLIALGFALKGAVDQGNEPGPMIPVQVSQ